ncbi:MAG TPA: beta-ketothiolase BktB [Solirubrobacteraceae bacterium]|nr:beta-ketothiolase BktB [Solirubrobacteraceae bacterium]
MTGVVITSAARTAIGSFGRSLRDVPPTELGATAARAAIDRAGLEPGQVEQVVFGNVIHTAIEDHYLARVVGINAGIPKEAPALTVNRLCGSGLQAILTAAQMIQTGDAEVALAGGAESMSRGAYWLEGARWGERMGDASMIDSVVGTLTDPFNKIHMGVTAENLAKSHGISREAQDEFAFESHRRATAAIKAGRFDEEIVPIEVKSRKASVEFKADEHARPDLSLESLAKLKPAFDREGTVTPGNASGVNDAAAAVVVMSADRAEELGAPVRGRILSYAVCGVEPKTMGIGPVPAVRKALERAGKTLDQVDVIELNEAFAAQSLAVLQELELDTARVNPNGGAIGLGHPISATGAILVTKILGEMEREDHQLGLVTLCIGGGQGIAMLIERD